jgi:hypothetical protein
MNIAPEFERLLEEARFEAVTGNPRNLEAEMLLRRRHFNRALASLTDSRVG